MKKRIPLENTDSTWANYSAKLVHWFQHNSKSSSFWRKALELWTICRPKVKPGEMTRKLRKPMDIYGQFVQASLGMKGQSRGTLCMYVSICAFMYLCIYVSMCVWTYVSYVSMYVVRMPDRIPCITWYNAKSRISEYLTECMSNRMLDERQIWCQIERKVKWQKKHRNICDCVRILVR